MSKQCGMRFATLRGASLRSGDGIHLVVSGERHCSEGALHPEHIDVAVRGVRVGHVPGLFTRGVGVRSCLAAYGDCSDGIALRRICDVPSLP